MVTEGVKCELITHFIFNISSLGDISEREGATRSLCIKLFICHTQPSSGAAEATNHPLTATTTHYQENYSLPFHVTTGEPPNKYANAEDWFVNLNLILNWMWLSVVGYQQSAKQLIFHLFLLQALNGFLMILTCDGEVFFATHTIESYLGFHQVSARAGK